MSGEATALLGAAQLGLPPFPLSRARGVYGAPSAAAAATAAASAAGCFLYGEEEEEKREFIDTGRSCFCKKPAGEGQAGALEGGNGEPESLREGASWIPTWRLKLLGGGWSGGRVTEAGGLSKHVAQHDDVRLCTWGFDVMGRKLGADGGGLGP